MQKLLALIFVLGFVQCDPIGYSNILPCSYYPPHCPYGMYCDAYRRCVPDHSRFPRETEVDMRSIVDMSSVADMSVTQPMPSVCRDPQSCPSSSMPVCQDNLCLPCSTVSQKIGDSQCAAWSAAHASTESICIAGSCKECRINADCQNPGKPFCDQSVNRCVACREDAHCPLSSLCKRDENLLASGDTLKNIGECVASSDIVYVNKMAPGCATGTGTAAAPFCQIQTAVDRGKTYIRVVTGSDYMPITVQNSQRVIVYGPGKYAASLLAAQVMNARLILQDISVKAAAAAPSSTPLVQCTMGGYLTIRRADLAGMGVSAGGISASQCARVIAERVKVDLINGHGISILGGSNHWIVNSAIIRSGTAIVRAGLRLNEVSGSTFAFNTITGNAGGVLCETATSISDMIVQGNSTPEISAMCTAMRVVTSGVMLNNVAGGAEPTILADPMNQIGDKAKPIAAVSEDYFGTLRGVAPDIGFQEFK